jgi:hypothetical protein
MKNDKKIFVCLVIPIVAMLSNAATPAVADSKGLAKLRSIPAGIAGWKEDTTRFKVFDGSALFSIIDGGAPAYIDAWLIGGCVEELSGPDSTSAEIFIEDFGTVAAASAMFNKRRGEMPAGDSLLGFRKNEAAAEKVIGGCFACACFGRWYFELSMTGYSSFDKSCSATSSLLVRFKHHPAR